MSKRAPSDDITMLKMRDERFSLFTRRFRNAIEFARRLQPKSDSNLSLRANRATIYVHVHPWTINNV